ncbi:MAG: hypothetical protein LBV15_05790 [Planctomycetota bacterium]|jgi:hypothetical protein|nr:hypothetical protein [Planctomycetota bacterium]
MRLLTRALPLLLAAALGLSGEPGALDMVLTVPDPFVPGSGRLPKPGEWLEYRVAFQVDPLEDGLARAAKSKEAAREKADDSSAPEPDSPEAAAAPQADYDSLADRRWQSAFDPPRIWRVLPLRLEALRAEKDSLRVRMTFAGTTGEFNLPLLPQAGEVIFDYPYPQPQNDKIPHRLGDATLEADKVSRFGNGYGFVRLTHPDAPFGLLRFASPDVDFILVGFGSGIPPAFPLSSGDQADPPPGRLYYQD